MLPSADPPVIRRRTLILDEAAVRAVSAPIGSQCQSTALNRAASVDCALAGRALVFVILGDIDEVSPIELESRQSKRFHTAIDPMAPVDVAPIAGYFVRVNNA